VIADLLAAVAAASDHTAQNAMTPDVGGLLDMEWPDDCFDDLCKLSREGLVDATLVVDPDEIEHELTDDIRWSLTMKGRFEVYRR
jgi:hypothetical protein